MAGTLDEIRRITTAINVHLPLDRKELMQKARADGASWNDIAEAAGVTRQGAMYIVNGKGPVNRQAKELLGVREPAAAPSE